MEEWVTKIAEEARNRCPRDLRNAFTLEIAEKHGDSVRIRFESDKRAMPYVRLVILKNQEKMPLTVRKIFDNLLDRMEQQEREATGAQHPSSSGPPQAS